MARKKEDSQVTVELTPEGMVFNVNKLIVSWKTIATFTTILGLLLVILINNQNFPQIFEIVWPFLAP